MILPNATLFPGALLPLYIFEPRYRHMLAEALDTHRMFSVALQKPQSAREEASGIAGLGLIRVSVRHRDGTSHLVLQGLARVELGSAVRYKPFRVQKVQPLDCPAFDSGRVEGLLVRVRELLAERTKLGLPFPFQVTAPGKAVAPEVTPTLSAKEIIGYLDSLTEPSQVADLVACAVLPGAAQRQTILEALDVEARLGHLITFLLAEIRNKRKRVIHE